jgi:hypothetical protein
MIEAKTKQISGSTYTVTQMAARRALRMQAKLMKLLGPSAGVILSQADKSAKEADQCLPQAITLLVSQLDEKTFDLLVMELLEGVRKDNIELTPQVVDLEFAGNLNELFLLLQFVLEVNYSDFFQAGGILSTLLSPSKTIAESKEA